MNNDLMRYRVFTEPVEGLGITSIVTGRVDMQAMIFSTLNFFLVDIPFRVLAFLTDIIVAFLNLLDFTNGFSAMRQQFFDQSNQIFLRFIGGANGRITTGSLAFSFLSIALIYLTFQFFFGKGNFAKKAIHVMVVVMLGFGYFGTFNQNGKSVRGGIWLLDTVDNVATELRGSMITSFTFDDTEGSPANETASLTKYFENHVVRNTWKFLHSGSFTGEFASGQGIDVNMLISNEGLSGSDLEEFETARDEYLTEIAEVNTYVRNIPDYFVQKMFMVALGYANMLILGLPILFANLTISAFQLVLLMLVLLFPFALLLSFVPMMRHAAFNMLKMMLGILFIPVLLSFLLGVIFYLNQAIDSFILARAGQLFGMGTGSLTMANLPVGNTLLILFSVIVIVKGFFLHLIWKNKGRVLQLVSGGVLDDKVINQPKEVVDKAVEKTKEVGKNVGETALGAGKVALGVSTGHPGLIADGIVQATPMPNQSRNSLKNVIGKHFVGEDGKLDVQGGLSSMKDRVFGSDEQKGEEISLNKNNENGAQDVNVVNSDELVNDDLENKENIIIDDKVSDEAQQVNHELDFENLVVQDSEYSQEGQEEQEESYEADVENTMILEMENEIVSGQEEISHHKIPNDEFLVSEQEIEVSTMDDREVPTANGEQVSYQLYTEGEDFTVQEQEEPKSASIELRQMKKKEISQDEFISQEQPAPINDKQRIHMNDNHMTETKVYTNQIDSRQAYHSPPINDFANMIQNEIPNRVEDYTKIEHMSQEELNSFLEELDRERMA